jgi:hypothetical protein
LKQEQLFEPVDLEDPKRRHGSTVVLSNQSEKQRKLRNVVGTFYWLGCAVEKMAAYEGPKLDMKPFKKTMKSSHHVFEATSDSRRRISAEIAMKESPKPQSNLKPVPETSKHPSSNSFFSKKNDQSRSNGPPPKHHHGPPQLPHSAQTHLPRFTPTPPLSTSSDSSKARTPTPPLTAAKNAPTVEQTEELTVPMRSTQTGSFGCQVTGGSDSSMPPTIDLVVPGSPADQNGLQRNDVIISVDGELTQDLHHSEVVALMKHAGSKGNIVLGIRRKVKAEKPVTPTTPTSPPTAKEESISKATFNHRDYPTSKLKTESKQREIPNHGGTSPRNTRDSATVQVKIAVKKDPPAPAPPPSGTSTVSKREENKVPPQSKRGSGPTHIQITQKVKKDKEMEEFDEIMSGLADEEIYARPHLKKKSRSPVIPERTIPRVEGDKVTVRSKGHGATTPTTMQPGIGNLEAQAADSKSTSLHHDREDLDLPDTDYDIAKLEEQLGHLQQDAEKHGDEEELRKPGWDKKVRNGKETQLTFDHKYKASHQPKRSSPQVDEREQTKKKDGKEDLFSMLAQSTKLPPRVESPPPKTPPTVPPPPAYKYSPATLQDLADREAFLKEKMKTQREAREEEWTRLEHERQSMENARTSDHGSVRQKETEKHLPPQPKQQERQASLQQQDQLRQQQRDQQRQPGQQQQQGHQFTEERRQEMMEGFEKWLREEEEKDRVAQEQRRKELQQMEMNEQAQADKRLSELFEAEQERKRQEKARQKMEKEAEWILKLEQDKYNEQKRMHNSDWAAELEKHREEERRRQAEVHRQQRKIEWIVDLEKMKAEQVAARRQRTQSPRMPSPPAVESEEAKRKAEQLKKFDELMAQEEAREKEREKQVISDGTHVAMPYQRSPMTTRGRFVSDNQSYSLSKSMTEIPKASQPPTEGAKDTVADVHQFGGSLQQRSSWREPKGSPRTMPHMRALDHRHSFHSQQPIDVCTICSIPLGREPAMSVAETGLKYHARCLKCSVCSVSLASGLLNVGILLREGKPHCKHCFSTNAGLLMSEC